MNGSDSADIPPRLSTALEQLARTYGSRAAEDWLLVHRHFELGEGFAYLPVFVPEPAAAELARAELQDFLRRSGKDLFVVPLSTPADLRELSLRLQLAEPPSDTGALWVAAVPEGDDPGLDRWREAWKHAVARMNERRDVFRTRFQFPLLMVGPPWLQEILLRYAPDLWSVRTLVITLTPDTVAGLTGPKPFLPVPPDFRLEDIPKSADGLDPTFYNLRVVEPLRQAGRGRELADALIELADAYNRRGLRPDALRAVEEALQVARQLGGTDDAARLLLGRALVRWMRLLPPAEQSGRGELAVQEARQVLHPLLQVTDDPTRLAAAQTLFLLAAALYAQGRYAEAEQEHRAVLTVREGVLGPEHPDTLESWHNLAAMLWSQGKLAEAEREQRAVLALRERVLGPEHPATLSSRNNLAEALDAQSRYAEAELEQRAVLAIRERVLGPEHPDTLASRNNLAVALAAQGKHAEAEREHRAVLSIRERVLGPEHLATLSSRNNLANALLAHGKSAEAEQEHRTVLAIRERVLRPEHPNTLKSCYNLALALQAQGKNEEAKPFAQRAYKVGWRVLGEEHPALKNRKSLLDQLEGTL